MSRLALITLLVHSYDDAIAWFTRCLSFHLLEDTSLDAPPGKRWVRMCPPPPPPSSSSPTPSPSSGTGILLALAVGPTQSAAVGNQGGGRVMFFLEVPDFDAEYARMMAEGVRFREEGPRRENYGTVIQFEDLYGNGWDLIQPEKEAGMSG